jgi:glycosyltransferase involved in cell wall biosynthesis
MRVAIYDNLGNSAYIEAKALRRRGIEADVLLDPRDRFVMSDPRWEELDVELPTERLVDSDALAEVEIPSWVRRAPSRSSARAARYARAALAAASAPRAAALALRHAGPLGLELALDREWVVRSMRAYDCVVTYGFGSALAALAGAPCVARTWGGDITIVPFADESPGASRRERANARLQRLGFGSCRWLILSEPRYREHAARLGLTAKAEFLPLVVDTERYSPGEEEELRARFLPSNDSALVFVPSRQDWRWKGSDRMLRGFALAASARADAVLVCAGWGSDLERSRALASTLGIAERVHFLPFALSKRRLLRYFRAADVVADQFTLGWYGGSTFDAMSCAKPVLVHVDLERYGGDIEEVPPVANVSTPEEIAAALGRLLTDAEERERLGTAARRYVLAQHGDRLLDHLVKLYRASSE